MNAPLNRSPARRDAALLMATSDGSVEGVARHVSTDGCQFLLIAGMPKAGERMALPLEGEGVVSGTIRWVVEDRIGFAFDAPIATHIVSELTSHFAQLKALQLRPLPSQP